MESIQWTIRVLAITLAGCSFMFVCALIFSPGFRESGVSVHIGAVLGGIGVPLGAIATGSILTKDIGRAGKNSEEEDDGRK